MNGLHIIADLKEIDFEKLDFDEEKISNFFSSIISKNHLTEVGKTLYTFDQKNEITGIFALAESHISFHTWPEFGYVSIDIFVCNLKNDNSEKAEKIFAEIVEFFHCSKYGLQKIKRGL